MRSSLVTLIRTKRVDKPCRGAFCFFPCGDTAYFVVEDNHRLSGAASINDESVYRGRIVREPETGLSRIGNQRQKGAEIGEFQRERVSRVDFCYGQVLGIQQPTNQATE
jgi:hypothetical protein